MKSESYIKQWERTYNDELHWLWSQRHWIPESVIKFTLERLKHYRSKIQSFKDENKNESQKEQ